MLRVSKQQALERWDALPENIREALFADQNTLIVERICEAENLPVDKVPAVKRITGWVLMGFLHPEETKKEIQDAIQLDPQHAQKIADDLNSRLFSTFRADLDKIYAPPGAVAPQPAAIPATPSPVFPKPFEEIRKPPTAGDIKPSPEFELKLSKFFGTPAAGGPAVPPPKPLSEVVKPAAPQPAAPPMPPRPPTPPPTPVVLKKELELKTVQSAAPRLELPGERAARAGAVPGGKDDVSPALPPLPAHLEIGRGAPEPPKPPTVARTEVAAPRTVHYGDMKTPLPQTRPGGGAGPVPLAELGRATPSRPATGQGSSPEGAARPSEPTVPKPPAPPAPPHKSL